ncbi:MAG: putative TrmH family tRNA/rRNA methyltransferase [Firmicutes bacterium]|nr:putative TrmH family tRNA/rRNA methyltransferase [Bacillota bacterium]
MNQVEGRNPVLETLRAKAPINKLFVQKQAGGGIRQIFKLARQQGVVVVEVEKVTLDKMCEGRPHQGVVADVAVESYVEFEDLVAKALAEPRPLLVMLDHIEDPHNLGAILRSALAAGAQGVIIPKRRSAALSPTVAKVSAGAVMHLPVARVANLAQHVARLKDAGFTVVGAEASGKVLYDVKLTGPLALIVGSEDDGISRLLRENCDELVAIPAMGPIGSLNASVAAGVVLFEIVRQHRVQQ